VRTWYLANVSLFASICHIFMDMFS
jgi:hypothetical protein